MDTMFIRSKPVLHTVYVATQSSAACFPRSQSSHDIWKVILTNWTYVYAGPPDYAQVDQGISYISKEMSANIDQYGVKIVAAPIETKGLI